MLNLWATVKQVTHHMFYLHVLEDSNHQTYSVMLWYSDQNLATWWVHPNIDTEEVVKGGGGNGTTKQHSCMHLENCKAYN